jgi:hypothetical protein
VINFIWLRWWYQNGLKTKKQSYGQSFFYSKKYVNFCFVLPAATVNQCCQGAEISAAKLKKGRPKFVGAGKVRGRTFTRFIKKGLKRGRTFLDLVFHKIIYISCQILGLQTGLLNFSLPFWIMDHWKNCKIGLCESILCGGRNFSRAAEFFGWSSRKFLKLVGHTAVNNFASNLTSDI